MNFVKNKFQNRLYAYMPLWSTLSVIVTNIDVTGIHAKIIYCSLSTGFISVCNQQGGTAHPRDLHVSAGPYKSHYTHLLFGSSIWNYIAHAQIYCVYNCICVGGFFFIACRNILINMLGRHEQVTRWSHSLYLR